jgi:hypothetical protein
MAAVPQVTGLKAADSSAGSPSLAGKVEEIVMATVYKPQETTRTGHELNCCCPTCKGLAIPDRPLFAPGQTLAAADLSALQDYAKAKNRLHNRYLHGWGVVCGLEVICDDCEGSVTIRPGYAIDPCGEDIVVGANTRFDLVAAMRGCADQARAKTGDCDPWMPPPDPGCKDAESHWCIVEAAYSRQLTASQPAPKIANKGGCGGNCGGGCGGGCGDNSGGSCGCGSSQPKATTRTNPASSNSCAPRRVIECFDVSAIKSKEGCAPTLENFWGRTREGSPLGIFDVLIPAKSLLRKIVDCVFSDLKALDDSISSTEQNLLLVLTAASSANLAANSQISLSQTHALICKLKALLLDMLMDDDHPVRCQLKRTVGEIMLAAPQENTPRQAYFELAKAALKDLAAAFLQMLLDCICHAFIPQCEPDPCDDRVELACVTVKAGKILAICNHSCRRYAGAFPSTFYWMSLVPVIPLIARLLATICCQPDLVRRNSPLVNDLMPLLDRFDPTGKMRQVIAKDNFALPKRYAALAGILSKSKLTPLVADRITLMAEKAESGDKVTAAPKRGPNVSAADTDLLALRSEVTAMRAEIEDLKAQRPTDPNR